MKMRATFLNLRWMKGIVCSFAIFSLLTGFIFSACSAYAAQTKNVRVKDKWHKNLIDGRPISLTMNPVSKARRVNDIQREINESRENAITRAVKKVSPAVVGINVTQGYFSRQSPFSDDPFFRHFWRDSPSLKKVKSLGSGFLFSKRGYILTNQHVVQDAIEIIVTVEGGRQYVAKKIGEDFTTDIAVLKIEGNDFPHAKLGNSDDVIIGEWAIALGNPFGLFDISSKATVTVGVISGTDQDFGKQNNNRIYEDMIQTDAAINSGNSGGPLVNCDGEVIGINAWIISGSETMSANIGLGFAIPINRIKRILDDLLNYGHVDRSFWTGIHYDRVTAAIARYLGLRSVHGVIVSDIDKGSPAAKAGLKISDIIFAIDENRVNKFQDVESIINSLDYKPGDVMNLRIFRDRGIYTIRIILEAHPSTQLKVFK